jgi:hypothetical protein
MKRFAGFVFLLSIVFAAASLHASSPDIYVYPDFINFGEVKVDGVSSAKDHFYVFNKGDADLIIPGLRITATSWIHFNLDVLSFSYAMECSGSLPEPAGPTPAVASALVASGAPVIIPPGGSCTVWVTFKPKAKQPGGPQFGGDKYGASLEITSSDPDESLSIHRMFGTGTP